MIGQYVEAALRKACYDKLGDGTFYGEVPRLRGVLATGTSLDAGSNSPKSSKNGSWSGWQKA